MHVCINEGSSRGEFLHNHQLVVTLEHYNVLWDSVTKDKSNELFKKGGKKIALSRHRKCNRES